MRSRHFVPQDEIDDIQVNQKDLYFDANAVKDADILDENLAATPDDTNDEEQEE